MANIKAKTILILTMAFLPALVRCDCDDSDEIQCVSGECIPVRYICDDDDDCEDGSDERSDVCRIWSDYVACDHGDIACGGSCYTVEEICKGNCTVDPASNPVHPAVCQMFTSQEIPSSTIPDEDPRLSLKNATGIVSPAVTASSLTNAKVCPMLYTRLGNEQGPCVSIFTFGERSWEEADHLCISLFGRLFTFNDITQFASLLELLQSANVKRDFWLGGKLNETTSTWHWLDGTPMPTGSPYWAIRSDDYGSLEQAPTSPPDTSRGCVSLNSHDHYLLGDDDCSYYKSALCLFTGNKTRIL
ncbi:uncharacterized protein LOC143033471 [Oratosquilla oratoria]|uniref:uncharacterized protein LOC143033471 n=1 Tax=Oratosquilla oratoria TaxID=337810 RepID=UPI003F75DCBA